MVMKDRCLTIRKTAEEVQVSSVFPHVILCDHSQNDCEICPRVSVGGTDILRLAVAQYLLDTINVEPGFLRLLAVPENENLIVRIPFSEQR
ncbi:hypothetical protein TNCV_2206111 [Trichonephila clavipes]|nr:hypothetical protein TNCV_2206111 [Trichonephila clavipes]